MIKRMMDWKGVWIQTLVIIVSGVIAYFCLPVLAMKIPYFAVIENDGNINEYLSIGNKFLQAIIIMATVTAFIRKYNTANVLIQKYAQYPHTFIGYWYCSRVMNFTKCSLRMVPIPMQFKLILSGLFREFIYDDGVNESKEQDIVTVSVRNNNEITSRVNLVIADTYDIRTVEQIPADQISFTTYEVKRDSDNIRRKSDKLKEEVINILRGLPNHVREVNVYSTLNTYNSYKICREAFDTGARDYIDTIYVYDQGKHDGRLFESPVKIKLK